MNFLFVVVCLIAFFAWIWPSNPKGRPKKFGEGMFADTDASNWKNW